MVIQNTRIIIDSKKKKRVIYLFSTAPYTQDLKRCIKDSDDDKKKEVYRRKYEMIKDLWERTK
jgi:hypothetical protein